MGKYDGRLYFLQGEEYTEEYTGEYAMDAGLFEKLDVNGKLASLFSLFTNHLKFHEKRERWQQKVILALIGIVGSVVVALIIIIVNFYLK